VQPSASKPALTKRPLGGAKPPGAKAAPPSIGKDDPFAKARKLKMEEDRQAEIRRNQPREFRMKVGEGGEKGVEILLLDTARLPDMPFFHYMHRWGYVEGQPGSGKTEVCIQDGPDGCPLCESLGRQGKWEMALSCIDNRPYTPNSGPNAGKTVQRSKKLVTVKSKMIPKFERLYKEHKTFRGMVVRLFRDNKQDESIGSDVQFVRFLNETQLAKYADMAKPVDYEKAFPRPTYDQLASQHGGGNSGGGNRSSGGNSRGGAGSADFDGSDDDSIPF
jgi:hypothetical protein